MTKKIIKNVLWFLPLCFYANLSLSAENPKTLTAYTQELYPLSYTKNGDGEGEVYGFATQIVKALFQEAGLEAEISIMPWSRALHLLDIQENLIVYSMIRNAKREDKHKWIGKIHTIKVNLYGLKEKRDSLPKTLEQAKNYSLVSLRSGALFDYFKAEEFKNLKLINGVERFMPLLARNRYDLFPSLEISMRGNAKRLGIDPNIFIKTVELSELNKDLYIAASQQTDDELVFKLQAAYKKIVNNGTYGKIISEMELTNR